MHRKFWHFLTDVGDCVIKKSIASLPCFQSDLFSGLLKYVYI